MSDTLAQQVLRSPEQDPTPPVAPNLRPALVDGQRIWVQCPPWCVTDHVAENERHLMDVSHCGASVDLLVPRQGGRLQLLASARLLASDSGTAEERATLVNVDFEDVESLYLSASEADAAADRVAVFEGQLRLLGRVARGEVSAV